MVDSTTAVAPIWCHPPATRIATLEQVTNVGSTRPETACSEKRSDALSRTHIDVAIRSSDVGQAIALTTLPAPPAPANANVSPAALTVRPIAIRARVALLRPLTTTVLPATIPSSSTSPTG